MDHDLDLDDIFPTWFWAVGAVLVVGVTVALVAWYVQHPDRSPWTDFAVRFNVPDDVSSLVGTPPSDGDGPVEG
jgi:hypothetical protein